MKIAIVGSGISGLSSAYLAQYNGHEVFLYEKNNYFGGHSNTIDIFESGNKFPVDTGFLVHNPKTYPNLIELFRLLEVPIVQSQMTLSIQIPDKNIEWGGTNLRAVFAQVKNLINPSFYRMLFGIIRFNKNASKYLVKAKNNPQMTLQDLLSEEGYGREMQDWYLIPMAAAIWSTPAEKILNFPALSFLQFCLNHNLLQVNDRPIWRTIRGGSREYVKKITDTISNKYLNVEIQRVERNENKWVVQSSIGQHEFDLLILATAAGQAASLMKNQLSQQTINILQKFKVEKNLAIVHSDESILPKHQHIWSAWNYVSSVEQNHLSVSYLINQLQPLPTKTPIVVTLNSNDQIDPQKIYKKIEYQHPSYDVQTIEAQKEIKKIQGNENVFFAGAWLGYGFHEDGLKSALQIAKKLNWKIPWSAVYE